jgi:hypothetical protein
MTLSDAQLRKLRTRLIVGGFLVFAISAIVGPRFITAAGWVAAFAGILLNVYVSSKAKY